MQKLAEGFADHFRSWEICLPEEAVRERTRGKINKAGWSIWYLFGCDAQGEYLDYYATHRMTSDSHTRIRADGSVEGLPSLSEMFVGSDDPVENTRLKSEAIEANKRVETLLEERGFCLSGDEPMSNQIRRMQMSGKVGADDSPQASG